MSAVVMTMCEFVHEFASLPTLAWNPVCKPGGWRDSLVCCPRRRHDDTHPTHALFSEGRAMLIDCLRNDSSAIAGRWKVAVIASCLACLIAAPLRAQEAAKLP